MDFYSLFFFLVPVERIGRATKTNVLLSYLNSNADLMFIFPDWNMLIKSFVKMESLINID